MYDSARRWIKYDVADGTQLAIVKFRYLINLFSPLNLSFSAQIISYEVFFVLFIVS
jgi:hypothetical protein